MIHFLKTVWAHPSNNGREVVALGRVLAWQLYKRTIARPLTVRAYGGKFRCHPDSHDAGRMIYFRGEPDPSEMSFLRRYLRQGDNVIDAGANVGIYTLLMASIVGKSAKIISFEPDPRTAERLRENVALNCLANVTVRQAAVSNFIGAADFTQGADTGNALFSIRTFDRPPQTVEVTMLDTEIGNDKFAFLKMDVEGAEWDALKGAEQNLRRCNPPVIQIELSERLLGRAGVKVADIAEWLKDLGYTLWRYDRHLNTLYPFVSGPRQPGHVGDAFAIADAELNPVRQRLTG